MAKRFGWYYLEEKGPLSYVFGRKQGNEFVEKMAIVSLASSECWHWVILTTEDDFREGDEPTKTKAMDKAINALNLLMPRSERVMDYDMAKVRALLDKRRDNVVPDHRSYSEILRSIIKEADTYNDQLSKIEKIVHGS